MNVRTTHTHDAPPDPREQAARRFPLIPRSKPPCPTLQVRLDQIRSRARATGDNADKPPLLRAAQALNLAALTASDTGLPDLARQLCLRQATIFLTARPFDAATAKLALQPLINIGRLLIRDGDGAAAYQLFEQLLTAAKTRTNTTLDGVTVPFTDLTRSTADHREIAQWLWQVLLSDGTRALAQAGRWPEALEHARQHKAIGQRLLDGRQIAILALVETNQHHQAASLLADSDTPTPWEEAVSATLGVLCRLRADQDARPATTHMIDRFLTLDASDRDHTTFRTRLGLCVTDLAGDTPERQRITDTLVHQTLQTQDAYTARDILTHPPSAHRPPLIPPNNCAPSSTPPHSATAPCHHRSTPTSWNPPSSARPYSGKSFRQATSRHPHQHPLRRRLEIPDQQRSSQEALAARHGRMAQRPPHHRG